MKLELKKLALAMAQQEGWFDPVNQYSPSIPHACNNPGNLRWAHPRFQQNGKLHGYVLFMSKGWGAQALLNDLRAKLLAKHSLDAAIRIYCPSGDGDNKPSVYVQHVAGWLGIDDPMQLMSDLFQDPGYISGQWEDFPAAGPPRPFGGKV